MLCRSETAALRSPCAQPLCVVDLPICCGVEMKEAAVEPVPCAAGSMQMLPNGDVIPIPLAQRIRAAAREKAKATLAAAAAAAASPNPTAASDEATGPSWKLGAGIYEAAGAFAEGWQQGQGGGGGVWYRHGQCQRGRTQVAEGILDHFQYRVSIESNHLWQH